MIINILVTLGLFLLYFPPIFVHLNQNLLKRYPVLTNYIYNIFIASILTGMMMGLVPQASSVFLFYFILFFGLRAFIRGMSRASISNIDAFTLSIYICFAVSVLWEIPIQLTNYQNIDAVIISGLKVIAIPLFFHKIYKLGFQFKNTGIIILSLTIFYGITLIHMINIEGIGYSFWFAHAFRIPIIILFLSFIPYNITYINADKNTELL